MFLSACLSFSPQSSILGWLWGGFSHPIEEASPLGPTQTHVFSWKYSLVAAPHPPGIEAHRNGLQGPQQRSRVSRAQTTGQVPEAALLHVACASPPINPPTSAHKPGLSPLTCISSCCSGVALVTDAGQTWSLPFSLTASGRIPRSTEGATALCLVHGPFFTPTTHSFRGD